MCAALGARTLLRKHHIPDSAFKIALAERNNRLGIKIRISGGGKCNITHAGDMKSVLAEGFFRQSEQRFLKPSFFELSNDVVLSWLHQKGVQTLTRENGRIFPRSGKAEVPIEQKWNNLAKAMRRKLTAVSKKYFLGSIKEVPLERGEVSAGGVALDEVSPKTMRSRLVPNLYFAGEVLDVAGEVGGFNLQAAYSTGWVAGESVAKRLLAEHSLLKDSNC